MQGQAAGKVKKVEGRRNPSNTLDQRQKDEILWEEKGVKARDLQWNIENALSLLFFSQLIHSNCSALLLTVNS